MNVPAVTLDFATASGDPSTISGLLAWFNPSGISGTNGSLMTTWTDSGPTGYVLSPVNVGQGPTVLTNGLNGFTVANSGGVTGLGTSSGFSLSAANTWTCFCVVYLEASPGYYCGFRGDGNNTGVRLGAHSGTDGVYSYVLPNVIDNPSVEGVTSHVWHTIIASSNGGAESVYVDNVQLTLSGTHLMNAPTSAFQICSSTVQAFLGKMVEIGWYDQALGSTDRATLFNYTHGKYGI